MKSGRGILALIGANTYFGGTRVQSGTLKLNGSVSGDVNIELKGSLAGNAEVNGSINCRGKISPGNSIGEILTTDLHLYPSSTYFVEVNSAGFGDEIIASGESEVPGGLS